MKTLINNKEELDAFLSKEKTSLTQEHYPLQYPCVLIYSIESPMYGKALERFWYVYKEDFN